MSILNVIALAFGLIGTACSIIFGVAAFRRNNKSDYNNEGRQTCTMLSDIGYIKSGVDDIKRKQEKQDDFNIKLREEITSVKDSAKYAHERINVLEERLNH